MKDHLAIAAIALLFLTSTDARAACSRDDISYYLSEGFTQEQITAICTAGTEAAPAPTPAETEPAADAAPAPPAVDNIEAAERYLRQAIDGNDILIEGGFLYYTAKICIPYGQFNDNKDPWSMEACELVRHKVNLRGMKAKREWVSLSLTEPRQVYLVGEIERELVGDLDDYSSTSRSQIMQNLQTEVKAIVPIRENMSPDRLLESLNRLAT